MLIVAAILKGETLMARKSSRDAISAQSEVTPPASSLEVRARLVEALELDLVGPWAGHALEHERLKARERPSNWYLTGFLIPAGTPPEQRADAEEDDDLGAEVPGAGGLSEESSEDRKAAKKSFFPSSMGLSFLVSQQAQSLGVIVRWGDYEKHEGKDLEGEDPDGKGQDAPGKPVAHWQRVPRAAVVPVAIPSNRTLGLQRCPPHA